VAAYRMKWNCPYFPGTRYAQDIAHLRQQCHNLKSVIFQENV